jgi:hypothetical protein
MPKKKHSSTPERPVTGTGMCTRSRSRLLQKGIVITSNPQSTQHTSDWSILSMSQIDRVNRFIKKAEKFLDEVLDMVKDEPQRKSWVVAESKGVKGNDPRCRELVERLNMCPVPKNGVVCLVPQSEHVKQYLQRESRSTTINNCRQKRALHLDVDTPTTHPIAPGSTELPVLHTDDATRTATSAISLIPQTRNHTVRKGYATPTAYLNRTIGIVRHYQRYKQCWQPGDRSTMVKGNSRDTSLSDVQCTFRRPVQNPVIHTDNITSAASSAVPHADQNPVVYTGNATSTESLTIPHTAKNRVPNTGNSILTKSTAVVHTAKRTVLNAGNATPTASSAVSHGAKIPVVHTGNAISTTSLTISHTAKNPVPNTGNSTLTKSTAVVHTAKRTLLNAGNATPTASSAVSNGAKIPVVHTGNTTSRGSLTILHTAKNPVSNTGNSILTKSTAVAHTAQRPVFYTGNVPQNMSSAVVHTAQRPVLYTGNVTHKESSAVYSCRPYSKKNCPLYRQRYTYSVFSCLSCNSNSCRPYRQRDIHRVVNDSSYC